MNPPSALLISLLSSAAAGDAPAAAPRVDGVFATEEWTSARREPLQGGGEVLWIARGDRLYIGLRGEGRGIASLCLHAAEDRVDILHASAALGTATYRLRDGVWSLEKGFKWEVRDSPNEGAAANAEAEAFQKTNGWLGSSNHQGSSTWEFEIERPAHGWRLGFNFLAIEPMTTASWPADMGDDCPLVPLAQGNPPPTARFSPERWARID